MKDDIENFINTEKELSRFKIKLLKKAPSNKVYKKRLID